MPDQCKLLDVLASAPFVSTDDGQVDVVVFPEAIPGRSPNVFPLRGPLSHRVQSRQDEFGWNADMLKDVPDDGESEHDSGAVSGQTGLSTPWPTKKVVASAGTTHNTPLTPCVTLDDTSEKVSHRVVIVAHIFKHFLYVISPLWQISKG